MAREPFGKLYMNVYFLVHKHFMYFSILCVTIKKVPKKRNTL